MNCIQLPDDFPGHVGKRTLRFIPLIEVNTEQNVKATHFREFCTHE